MPTCRFHGSGGSRNERLGLIRYLSWIIIGCPDDTPWQYAKYAALASAMEMMFNHGIGSVDQRLKAAQWLLESDDLGPRTRSASNDMREAIRGDEGTGSAEEVVRRPKQGPITS